jgi:biotin operon repressor
MIAKKPPMFPGRPMNHKLVILAYQVPAPSPLDRNVLMGLAEHAHQDGTNAFPAMDLIAEKCGISRRSVLTSLKSWEKAGMIIPTRRKGGYRLPNCYNFNVERMLNAIAEKGAKSAPFDDQNPAKLAEYPATENCENPAQFQHPETAQSTTENCEGFAHEQESKNKNQYQVSGASAPTETDSFEGLPPGVAGWLKTLEPKPVPREGKLYYHGTDLRRATQAVAEALKLGTTKKWPKFWEPLANWLREGFTVSQITYQVKQQLADTGRTAKDIGSLAYFDDRLHENEPRPSFRPSHRTLEQMLQEREKAQQATQAAPSAPHCIEKGVVPTPAATSPAPVQVPALNRIEYLRDKVVQAAPPLSPEEQDRLAEENVAKQLAALGIDPDELAKRRAEMAERDRRRAELQKEMAEHLAAKAAAGD